PSRRRLFRAASLASWPSRVEGRWTPQRRCAARAACGGGMWRAEDEAERRRFARINLGATATLLQRGGQVGRFTVQNLSAGGALLTGASDVARSAPLRVLLELPDGEALTLGARVLRRAKAGGLVALAVAFRHISAASEDRIQDALLALIDRAHRIEHPAVLVVDASPEVDRKSTR